MTALTRLQHLHNSHVHQSASSAPKLSNLWRALQGLRLLRVNHALHSAEVVACATVQLSCLAALTRLDARGLVLEDATLNAFTSESAGLPALRHLEISCDSRTLSPPCALEDEITAKVAGLPYLSVLRPVISQTIHCSFGEGRPYMFVAHLCCDLASPATVQRRMALAQAWLRHDPLWQLESEIRGHASPLLTVLATGRGGTMP